MLRRTPTISSDNFFSLARVSACVEIKSGISFEVYTPRIFIICQLTSATLNVDRTTRGEKDCKNANWHIREECGFFAASGLQIAAAQREPGFLAV